MLKMSKLTQSIAGNACFSLFEFDSEVFSDLLSKSNCRWPSKIFRNKIKKHS